MIYMKRGGAVMTIKAIMHYIDLTAKTYREYDSKEENYDVSVQDTPPVLITSP